MILREVRHGVLFSVFRVEFTKMPICFDWFGFTPTSSQKLNKPFTGMVLLCSFGIHGTQVSLCFGDVPWQWCGKWNQGKYGWFYHILPYLEMKPEIDYLIRQMWVDITWTLPFQVTLKGEDPSTKWLMQLSRPDHGLINHVCDLQTHLSVDWINTHWNLLTIAWNKLNRFDHSKICCNAVSLCGTRTTKKIPWSLTLKANPLRRRLSCGRCGRCGRCGSCAFGTIVFLDGPLVDQKLVDFRYLWNALRARKTSQFA